MADKYSISASVYTSSYDATSDTIHYEGHVEFGAWYYYGVRLELWVDGTCVDQSSGYTTSTYGSCCYVSYDWTRSKTHSEANPSWGLYAYSDTVDGVGGVGEDDSVTGTVYCGPKYSYAVKYDANGGSGAPSAQTKWHGETLALSSAKPTRSGYTFVGWNTDKTAVKSQYAPGASYTGNAALTLYAVWKLAYVAPTVTVSAVRCTSSGAASQSGTYAKVTGTIKADTSLNSANKLTKHVIEYRKVGASSWTAGATVTDSAATASVSSVVGGGNIATASAYEVRVTAYDSGGSGYAVATVPAQFRLVDFGYKGKSVGIGAVASDSASLLDVGIPLSCHGWVDGRANINGKTLTANSLPVYGWKQLFSGSYSDTKSSQVTLSASAAGFKFLLIEFETDGGSTGSVLVSSPNGRSVVLSCNYFSPYGSMYMYSKTVTVSGTTINTRYAGGKYLTGWWGSGDSSYHNEDVIGIVRVWGLA